MIRRSLVVLFCIALSGVGLSACTWSPAPKDDNSAVAAPEGWTQLPVEGEPMASPPPAANTIIPVSIPIDTTSFTRPPAVSGWELSEDLSCVVVTIRLSKDDWSSLATQAGFDESVDPLRVQLGEATARSLIDLDQLANEAIQLREERGVTPVDIRTIEAHYGLVVSAQ
jgi:hypothetical protein